MFLAGDIGGTRSRFYAMEQDRVVFEHIYSSKDYSNFIDIVENFLKISGLTFSSCVFGIAGVVTNGHCKTTNLPWEVSIQDINKVLRIDHGFLINDLALLSYGLVDLEPQMLEIFQTGHKNEGPMLVVCPGTGLGVACVLHTQIPLEILATEAGHADFPPTTELELELLNYFINRFKHVSIERFVSGSGLCNVYQFLCHKHNKQPSLMTSEAITEAALQHSDPLALKTCELFLNMLGSTLGNLALNYIPYKGVYMCGALMRHLYPLINKQEFLSRFSSKGRFENLLKKMPVLVVKEQQLAVRGARMFYKNLNKRP